MKLIDKDALVAEIERRIDELYDLLPDASKVENGSITMSEACNTGKYTALETFKRFIDSLEVRKTDLETQIEDYINSHFTEDCDGGMISDWYKVLGGVHYKDLVKIAKHFFELGVNASNPLTWEDIKLIWTIGDEIPYMPEEDFFKELLKRFKAQKGE